MPTIPTRYESPLGCERPRGALALAADDRGRCATEPRRLEIDFSARSAANWDRLVGALDAFEPIETVAEQPRRAKRFSACWHPSNSGAGSAPDLLVAAATEALRALGSCTATHADLLTRATGQACERVVLSGTADQAPRPACFTKLDALTSLRNHLQRRERMRLARFHMA